MSVMYFVDTENVPYDWHVCVMNEQEDDVFIVLFWTCDTPPLTIAMPCFSKLCDIGVQFECISCYKHDRPNAADFQLVSELGYRIASKLADKYVIVSGDKGFDVVSEYWKSKGFDVHRVEPYRKDGATEFEEGVTIPPEAVRGMQKDVKNAPASANRISGKECHVAYVSMLSDAGVSKDFVGGIADALISVFKKPKNCQKSYLYQQCTKMVSGTKRQVALYKSVLPVYSKILKQGPFVKLGTYDS